MAIDAAGSAPMQAWAYMALKATTPGSGIVYIGRDRTVNTYWNGDIAAVIGYSSTLNSTDEQAVEAYLADKFGL
jgi:hypothetical protein